MDFASFIHVYRPYIFDFAGLLLIASVLLYFTYIRYDFPWLARFSFYLLVLGGAPILYLLFA